MREKKVQTTLDQSQMDEEGEEEASCQASDRQGARLESMAALVNSMNESQMDYACTEQQEEK